MSRQEGRRNLPHRYSSTFRPSGYLPFTLPFIIGISYCIFKAILFYFSGFDFHQTYTETRGHNFTLNASFEDIDHAKYDGLVIAGGRAPEYLAMDAFVLNMVRNFVNSGKPVASICHGQLILAAAGAVGGRRCTGFAAVGPTLIAAGALWIEPDTMAACVVDGNIITAATYFGHPEFIRLFVKALGGTISESNKRILFLCGVTSHSMNSRKISFVYHDF